MSVIVIRLEGLPLTAKSTDIREFFYEMKIPKGAVNIVGGEKGIAFICFATDEDARLAMDLSGGMLHNEPVRLFLSSKKEMEMVIATAHSQVVMGGSGSGKGGGSGGLPASSPTAGLAAVYGGGQAAAGAQMKPSKKEEQPPAVVEKLAESGYWKAAADYKASSENLKGIHFIKNYVQITKYNR